MHQKRHPMPRQLLALALCLPAGLALAQETEDGFDTGGKLLLTGGVSQVEGAAGGGLTPWAVIGGYGTRDQVGASAFYTRVDVDDYALDSYGVLVGLYDRVELSVSRQKFDTQAIGGALGLGNGFTFTQETFGVKLRVAGDAVLEQDSWLPQIAVGAQYKKNDQPGVLAFVGARDDSGVDYYLSATKLYLDKSLLLNGTVRLTRANQFGILGFGGDRNDDYEAQFEGSVAWLLNRHLAIGGEYRMKPDNLGIAEENDAWDVFVAWAPSKHVSLTVAYVDLGNIVIADNQRGVYASLQVGF
ncbi:MAG TPA: DUF3034 domain-containing protein [Arenimonas sp.]|nr:DUF3034 domain-containing protein [Arenimonas sp.]